jgi:hypothetical protein
MIGILFPGQAGREGLIIGELFYISQQSFKVYPVNGILAWIRSTVFQKLFKRPCLPAAFRQAEAARRGLPAVDIAAFHSDRVRSADIRKGIVADHQHL